VSQYGAWLTEDIQGVPLLAASSTMENIPMTAKLFHHAAMTSHATEKGSRHTSQ